MTAVDELAAPAAPDDEIPPHAEQRTARRVKVGWHVQVDGRFQLVEKVAEAEPWIHLWFDDESMLSVRERSKLMTRTPADQMAYMSAILPTHTGPQHYRPPRDRRLGTLYGGSAPARMPDSAS